ncbi:MAG: adenylate/guanylate cyclase domain-containing protein, partial [Bacteroidota bacterium]
VYLETRIGLNSGNMIVGNIGHTNRLEYTAIGDTVNLASRLEGVNKVFGTNIIISESTYLLAREFIRARELDLLRVKGKQLPIRIYELIAKTGSLPDPVEEKLGLFAEALKKYRTKEFAEAVHIFQRILSIDPADGPSLAYIERCRKLTQERLPEDWDGVYTLTTK